MDNIIEIKTVSFLDKIMPTADFPPEENNGILYKNSSLCFQVAIKNQKIIIDGAIKINTQLQKVQVQRVGYVPSNLPIREGHDSYLVDDKPGLYPDCLFDVNCDVVRLPMGINNVFLVTVDYYDGLLKGNYPIEITLLDKNETIGKVLYVVNYTDLELEKPTEKYFNWIHYDSIAVLHNEKPFTKDYYAVFKEYLKLFKRGGANVLMVPLITPPLDTHFNGERFTTQLVKVVKKDGKYYFDFSLLAEFFDLVVKEGIEYFEFPPFFSQWGAKHAAKIIVEENGVETSPFGWNSLALSNEYVEFLTSMLSALSEFLQVRGYSDRCYFHISDETDKYREHYLLCKKIVEDNLKGVHFIDAVTKAENLILNGGVQVLSISETVNVEDLSNIDAIYCCWGDYNNNLSNRFFCMPLERTAVIWIQMYLNNAKYLLHWGFNFYQDYLSYNYVDPFVNSDVGGIFPSGDAFLVYPEVSKKKALSSIRLEALRYGKEILALLYTLEKLESKEYVIQKLLSYGFKKYNEYPHSQGWLKNLERDLYTDIAKLMEI